MPTNKFILPLVAVIATLSLFACSNSYSKNGDTASSTTPSEIAEISPAALALNKTMRKLWSDHIIWTRQYIIAAVAGTPDAKAAANRLLQNQVDIGNAFVPYYGAEAGTKITDLLKQHILIAVDLVAAAKAGDNVKFKDADQRWHANANDIATFLSAANPAWPKQAMLDMLNEHLSVTTQEAVARLKGNWDDDVAAFDKIFNYALVMGDMFSYGIVEQFPNKF